MEKLIWRFFGWMRCLKLKGGKSRVEFISSFHLVFAAGAKADKIKHPCMRDKLKFHASFILTPFPIDLLLKACTQGVFGSWYVISLHPPINEPGFFFKDYISTYIHHQLTFRNLHLLKSLYLGWHSGLKSEKALVFREAARFAPV